VIEQPAGAKPDEIFPIGRWIAGHNPTNTAGPSITRPDELEWLNSFVKQDMEVLEVGTFCGSTVSVLADRNPRARFTAVDWVRHKGAMERWCLIGVNLLSRENVRFFRGTDREFFDLCRADTFDLIFLDGGHEYQTVADQLHHCLRIAKTDALVIVHDTGHPRYPGPEQAVWRAIQSGAYYHLDRQSNAWALRIDSKALAALEGKI